MSRTETMAVQVHPRDEQSQIDLMQQFHWSVLGTQEIKTLDNHLERRGDTIVQVSNTEHYVKLSFSRALDLPNLKEVKRLELEFFALKDPMRPKLFPGGLIVWAIASVIYGIGVAAWVAYYFLSYKPKSEEWTRDIQQNASRRQGIRGELAQYS